MSFEPERPRGNVARLFIVTSIAVGMFVVVLAIAAYATRHSIPTEGTVAGKIPLAVAIEQTDASNDAALESLDDGWAGAAATDASTDASADTGDRDASTRRESGFLDDAGTLAPAPAFETAALERDFGLSLGACIATAMREDPSAGSSVVLRIAPLETNASQTGVVAFSPAASPYFRRCASRVTTSVAINGPHWVEVTKMGTMREVPVP